MSLLSVYLRREPTTDKLLLEHASRYGVRIDRRKHADVAVYRDRECKRPFVRYPWWQSRPDRRNKRVVLNCFPWRAVWLPDAL
jgi:hypothetical protein